MSHKSIIINSNGIWMTRMGMEPTNRTYIKGKVEIKAMVIIIKFDISLLMLNNDLEDDIEEDVEDDARRSGNLLLPLGGNLMMI